MRPLDSQPLSHRLQFWLLALIVGLFLLERSSLILFGISHIAFPGSDETASGVLACDILDGALRAPVFAYQYESRSGDSLLEALLLVPLFKAAGRSLFAPKFLCLLSALTALLLWIALIKKHCGLWCAVIFGLLFALPPPMFARLNLFTTVASHHLLNPIVAAQLMLVFKIARAGNGRAPLWTWGAFGLLAGFGAYIFYTHIIFNAFCVLFLIVFRRRRFSRAGLGFFACGSAAGFLPWLIFRIQHRQEGPGFLSSMLKNADIDLWGFVQSFLFNVPHSFGYSYPSRSIGMVSLGFAMLFLAAVFLIAWDALALPAPPGKSSPDASAERLNSGRLLGIFAAAYPAFFMICLTLSPKQITPFEYWPSVGFFSNFGSTNIYQYRWLHSLYPFYFAAIAVGITALLSRTVKIRFWRWAAAGVLCFFLGAGAFKTLQMLSAGDFGKVFFYKGYCYDRMANRFLLHPSVTEYARAKDIVDQYPPEHLPEAYRFLGARAALSSVGDSRSPAVLERRLREIPLPYQDDFIYGIVLMFAHLPEPDRRALQAVLAKSRPDLLYRHIGFRLLAYKYYGLLLNWNKFIAMLPASEKWFFSRDLKLLKEDLRAPAPGLMQEIAGVPAQRQPAVVRGIGMLVGAEMLFDPLNGLDYPLDSRFGLRMSGRLKESFYRGVGMGFAETLCRFWRTLRQPGTISPERYEMMLEVEWRRCRSLMERLPDEIRPLMEAGFAEELMHRPLQPAIKTFLAKKGIIKGQFTDLLDFKHGRNALLNRGAAVAGLGLNHQGVLPGVSLPAEAQGD